MSLFKKIDLWQTNELITLEQALAIKQFENENKKPTLVYMLAFLSVFSIGIGIISLIASNWKEIPVFVKIFADFAFLSLVAYLIYDSVNKSKNIVKEALLVFYAILIIATIGLVAQIYHLKSNGYSAGLFWSVLVLPMFYITRKPIIPFVWMFVFSIFFSMFLFDKFPGFLGFVREIWMVNPGILVTTFGAFLVLLSFVIDLKLKDMLSYISKPLSTWVVITLIISIMVVEVAGSWWGYGYSYRYRYGKSDFYFISLIGNYLLFIPLLLNIASAYVSRKSNYLYIFLALFVVSIMSPFTVYSNSLIRFVMTTSVLSIFMIYAYKNNHSRLFNFLGGLVAIRIFVLYIQLFGSLLTTGFGLIFSGVVLLGIAYIWHKFSKAAKVMFKEKNNEA